MKIHEMKDRGEMLRELLEGLSKVLKVVLKRLWRIGQALDFPPAP